MRRKQRLLTRYEAEKREKRKDEKERKAKRLLFFYSAGKRKGRVEKEKKNRSASCG